MPITSVKTKGYSCFTGDWCGFDQFKPITVIIGRNNTGKSQLLELVSALCAPSRQRILDDLCLRGHMDEDLIKSEFPPYNASGYRNRYDWENHGLPYENLPITWATKGGIEILEAKPMHKNRYGIESDYIPDQTAQAKLEKILGKLDLPMSGKTFRHVLADRDIRREPKSSKLVLSSNGEGATNIIRDHLIRAGDIMTTREVIQGTLRSALNQIFGPDGEFTQISIQQHEAKGEKEEDLWEIFLEEERKGLIPLTSSGSGLKTVFLVLLNLLVIPIIERKSASGYVFAFEELENNLHPALLRRLLKFIEEFVLKEGCSVFLTTHSGATLDLFSRADYAQFVRVSHDGNSASTQTIDKFFDRAHVVGDLGAKASDILQANGIIWVEGPSDAVYINHWIAIFSGNTLLEGRDYACAFYGGALLAKTTLASPEENEDGLVNLIPLNRNVALICDSDRTSRSTKPKPRVEKAKRAIEGIPNATIWITSGKEIESYLPGGVLAAALGIPRADDPGQYELFFPSAKPKSKGLSYLETKLGRQAVDKVELAIAAKPYMTKEVMSNRLDWLNQMTVLTNCIRRWNE